MNIFHNTLRHGLLPGAAPRPCHHLRHSVRGVLQGVICATALCSPAALFAAGGYGIQSQLDVQWTQHPGAHLYNTEQYGVYHKVVNTPRYSYVVVRGCMLLADNEDYSVKDSNIFRFDHLIPSRGLYPLTRDIHTDSQLVRLVEYDPESGMTVIVYDNGRVAGIADSGDYFVSSDLSSYEVADDATPLSISFDTTGRGRDGSVYITTRSGYLELDLRRGHLQRAVYTGCPVERIVTGAGRRLAVMRSDESASQRLHLLKDDGTPEPQPLIADGQVLNMPEIATGAPIDRVLSISAAGADGFVFTREVSDTAYDLCAMQMDESGRIHVAQLTRLTSDLTKTGGIESLRVSSPWESEHGVWNNGRYFAASDRIVLADLRISPTLSSADDLQRYTAAALRSVPRFADTSKGAPPSYMKVSTFDGETFTYTVPYRGIMRAKYDAATSQWSCDGKTYAPLGPGGAVITHMAWHPDYGLLARGAGREHGFYGSSSSRDALSVYSDGEWRPISPFGVNPTQSATAQPIARIYGQRGVSIDPSNPDWVYSIYLEHGMTRCSLSNPAQPRQWVNDGHSTNAYTKPIFPRGGWTNNYSIPAFDADRTMWVAYDMPCNDFEGYLDLYYWSEADRLAWADGAVADASLRPKSIRIPGYTFGSGYRNGELLPLQSEACRNMLVYSPWHYYKEYEYCFPLLFDHAGTPDDTSDDRIFDLGNLHDIDTGAKIEISQMQKVYEDTSRGEVWFSSDRGLYIFRPDEVLSGRPFARRLNTADMHGGSTDGNLTDNTLVFDICADSAGRKWIATDNAGLICISADTSTVLGHYTTANSPLPSDLVYSVCATPDGSVFAGTRGGLVQLTVNQTAEDTTTGIVRVTPEQVPPGYTGYVRFSGLTPGGFYTARDGDGYSFTFTADADGRYEWDPSGSPLSGTINVENDMDMSPFSFIKL